MSLQGTIIPLGDTPFEMAVDWHFLPQDPHWEYRKHSGIHCSHRLGIWAICNAATSFPGLIRAPSWPVLCFWVLSLPGVGPLDTREHNQEFREGRSRFNSLMGRGQRRLHLSKNIQFWETRKLLKYCELLKAESVLDWSAYANPWQNALHKVATWWMWAELKWNDATDPVCESVLG